MKTKKILLWMLSASFVLGVSCSKKIEDSIDDKKITGDLTNDVSAIYAGVLFGSTGQITVKEMKDGRHEMKLIFDKDQDGKDDINLEVSGKKGLDLFKGYEDSKTGIKVKLIKKDDGSYSFDITIPGHGPIESIVEKFDEKDSSSSSVAVADMFEIIQLESGIRKVAFSVKIDGSLSVDKGETAKMTHNKEIKHLMRSTINLILNKNTKTFVAKVKTLKIKDEFYRIVLGKKAFDEMITDIIKAMDKAFSILNGYKITGKYEKNGDKYKFTFDKNIIEVPTPPLFIDFSKDKKTAYNLSELLYTNREDFDASAQLKFFRRTKGKSPTGEDIYLLSYLPKDMYDWAYNHEEENHEGNKGNHEEENHEGKENNLEKNNRENPFSNILYVQRIKKTLEFLRKDKKNYVIISVVKGHIYANEKLLSKEDYNSYLAVTKTKRKPVGDVITRNGEMQDSKGNHIEEGFIVSDEDGKGLYESVYTPIDKVMFGDGDNKSFKATFKGLESYQIARRKK